MKFRLAVAVLLAVFCTLAAAQTTVYESKDKAGPVFSDQPSFTDQPTAAKPVVVPPMNVMQGVTPPQPAPAAPLAPYYTSLAITTPANEGTIHSNTGAFDVRVQVAPALRVTSAGDRLKIKLDGNLLATPYRAAKLRITAADWNGAANPDNVAHTLQAAVIDRNGNVLLESAPVTFYAHRAAVGGTKR